MRVLITGATGFVGRHLANHLERHGHHVEVVSRRPNVGVGWGEEELQSAVDGCDGVVHLAGAGVLDRRWSDDYKREILESRTDTTGRIARACARAGRRLVSTSAVGFYGVGDMSSPLAEDAPAGSDFLAGVCQGWEEAVSPAEGAAVVRVGVVLGRGGGALQSMLLPFKLCAGGPIGSGLQPFPWIHIDDLVGLYTWLLVNPGQAGVFNGVAPGVCDQRTFARALGRALGRPAFLPTPSIALQLLLGERASLLVTGQHVVPARALAEGYTFAHGEVEAACLDLVSP